MSTKMYDLYRYDGGKIEQLVAWLKSKRRQYIKRVRRQIMDLKLPPEEVISAMQNDTRLGLRSLFNIEASAVIYLLDEQLYIQFFGLPSELMKEIGEKSWLVDFHYQNSSDQPAGVSTEEWDARSMLVDRILMDDDRPSRAGLVFIFADEHDIYRIVYG